MIEEFNSKQKSKQKSKQNISKHLYEKRKSSFIQEINDIIINRSNNI